MLTKAFSLFTSTDKDKYPSKYALLSNATYGTMFERVCLRNTHRFTISTLLNSWSNFSRRLFREQSFLEPPNPHFQLLISAEPQPFRCKPLDTLMLASLSSSFRYNRMMDSWFVPSCAGFLLEASVLNQIRNYSNHKFIIWFSSRRRNTGKSAYSELQFSINF